MSTDKESQLLQIAFQAGITSPTELANFMAQVNAESSGLNNLQESFCYTRSISQIPVQYAHREGDDVLEAARVDALNGHPVQLAELMYGGRNGNDSPGDGYTYRGRGYIQLTGKYNYENAGNALGIDFVKHPDLAANPENAAKVAVWFWQSQVPVNDRKDVAAATLAINGGHNGLKTRETNFDEWKKTLTPQVMQQLADGKKPDLPVLSVYPVAHSDTAHAKTLEQGFNGHAVHALQTDLAALGYTDGHDHPLKVDGDFGLETRHAVERFQHDHHLTVDGIAGPQTQRTLASAVRHAREVAVVQPGCSDPLRSFSDPEHPQHALYATLKEAMPPTSEARLTQATAACYLSGMRKPGDLGDIFSTDNNILVFHNNSLIGNIAQLDLTPPVPGVQQTMQQVQAYDHQQAQLQQQIQQSMAQQQGIQGPAPGMSMQ